MLYPSQTNTNWHRPLQVSPGCYTILTNSAVAPFIGERLFFCCCCSGGLRCARAEFFACYNNLAFALLTEMINKENITPRSLVGERCSHVPPAAKQSANGAERLPMFYWLPVLLDTVYRSILCWCYFCFTFDILILDIFNSRCCFCFLERSYQRIV